MLSALYGSKVTFMASRQAFNGACCNLKMGRAMRKRGFRRMWTVKAKISL